MNLVIFILAWWGLGYSLSFLFFSEDERVTYRHAIIIAMLCVPFGVLLPIGLKLLDFIDNYSYIDDL